VQTLAVQIPDPVQVKIVVSQVPDAAAVQVPVGLVHLRIPPSGTWVLSSGDKVNVVPLQVVPLYETPLSGTVEGSGTVSPAPPK